MFLACIYSPMSKIRNALKTKRGELMELHYSMYRGNKSLLWVELSDA